MSRCLVMNDEPIDTATCQPQRSSHIGMSAPKSCQINLASSVFVNSACSTQIDPLTTSTASPWDVHPAGRAFSPFFKVFTLSSLMTVVPSYGEGCECDVEVAARAARRSQVSVQRSGPSNIVKLNKGIRAVRPSTEGGSHCCR